MTVDLSSPRAALETLHKAAVVADADAYLKAMDPRVRSAMQPMIEASCEFQHKVPAVERLVREKVGDDEAGIVHMLALDMRLRSPMESAVGPDGRLDWTKVKIVTSQPDGKARPVVADPPDGKPRPVVADPPTTAPDAESATVTVADDRPLTMRTHEGKWYVVSPSADTVAPLDRVRRMKLAAESIAKMTDGLADLARRVQAGAVNEGNFEKEWTAALSGAKR